MDNFRCKNHNYFQFKGTDMGTRMAPTYANLFMGHIDKTFLNSKNFKLLAWFHSIDDIFVIWQHITKFIISMEWKNSKPFLISLIHFLLKNLHEIFWIKLLLFLR